MNGLSSCPFFTRVTFANGRLSTNLILQLPQHGGSFSIATTARAPFVRQLNLVGESGEFRYSRALFRGVGLFVKTCVQQVKPSRHDASLPKFVLDELPRQQIVLRRLELLCRYDFHQQVVFVKRNRTRVSRKAFVLSLPFGMARAAFHSGVARICRTRSNPPPMTAF